MALIIENGSVVTGANSYVTGAEIDAFADARGITLTGDSEVLAIKAMDYIEAQLFQGNKYSEFQPLQWPRTDVIIDGYLNNTEDIPQLLKTAQIQVALSIDSGNDPSNSTYDAVTKREKVGELEVEYADRPVESNVTKAVSLALKKLIIGGSSGGSVITVNRG